MSRIEDVARVAGVSTATVSRALRGLPKVSEHTRARVLAAAAELDYVASPTAASLASGKTRVVGVVVPYVTRWYFAQLISGASRVLREHGYHVLLLDVGDNGPQRTLLLDSRMLSKRVDAVLVLSLQLHDVELDLLRRLRLPVVTVGTHTDGWASVRIDDVGVARTATQYLVDLGHRRIGFIGGEPTPHPDFVTPSDRRRGYEEVMQANRLTVDPRHVLSADWTVRGGAVAGEELLRTTPAPTAVFVASDEMAMGVLHTAGRLGVRVPEQLSVVGVDDHEHAWVHGLTTVAQPVQHEGEQASRLLLDELARHGQHDPSTEVLTVPTQLVVRSSAAPPASSAAGPSEARQGGAVSPVGA
ncbi:MAG TPA: LacI family DNA-binding transcriptional regulator [Actinomycetales bacterium]|nr:LacI family DNA-binding transcriptional regulator [Actinomycetales bacterium]